MAKKKVVSRKKVRVAPDREEEMDVEEEIEVDDEPSTVPAYQPIGYPLTRAAPQEPAVPVRLSITEQHAQNEKAAAVCPDCIRMAPRHCARHKLNLPI